MGARDPLRGATIMARRSTRDPLGRKPIRFSLTVKKELGMRHAVSFVALLSMFSGCTTASFREATSADQSTASARPGGDGIFRIPVRENGLVGALVVPDTGRKYPGVLRIGGAEGGIQLPDAETIA